VKIERWIGEKFVAREDSPSSVEETPWEQQLSELFADDRFSSLTIFTQCKRVLVFAFNKKVALFAYFIKIIMSICSIQ